MSGFTKIAPVVLLSVLLSFSTAFGQTDTSDNSENSIERLDWMAGHWVGEAFGGVCEEIWSPESGGTMLGMFKVVAQGEVRFTELMSIVPGSDGPRLLVKHFNADMTGWEEKDKVIEFPFVSMGEQRVAFDGITYERTGENSLQISVTLSHGEGESEVLVIDCVKK